MVSVPGGTSIGGCLLDCLIEETPAGEPFRDGSVFVRGDLFEIKVDPAHPLHGKVVKVIRTGRNDAGKAMVSFRGKNPHDPDLRIQAELCRHSDQQYPDLQERRRRFALPLIVRECADGTRKARGQRPNSAEWEDIPHTDFNGSEIGDYTSNLIATPDGMPKNPDNEEVIWRRVMVSVPGGTSIGGRPTLEPEIKAAYKELRDAGDINFDAPKTRLNEPIREKVREYKGDPSLQQGLGNEAIRKVISRLFDADKNARSTSP